MPRKPTLTEERMDVLKKAFKKWYKAVPQRSRSEALRKLGREYSTKNAVLWYTVNTPPVNVIFALWLMTKDPAFLLTREEKRRFKINSPRAGPFMDSDDWPDLEVDESPPPEEAKTVEAEVAAIQHRVSTAVGVVMHDVPALERELARLTTKLEKLSRLPSHDPAREMARRVLVGPAMRLFSAAKSLSLEFPEAFEDLLQDLEFATTMTKGKK